MKQQLKFSVLTPSYNQGQFITDNIESILKQQYSNFEHIVMDGGSKDNTVDILKKYKHLIWKSEKDRGQTHALNKALSISKGEIICWLNSDDLLFDGAFDAVNDYFIKYPERKIVVGNLQTVNREGKNLQYRKSKKVTYDGLLNKGECVQQMSTFFKKEVFDAVGNFDESYNYTMDHEFWVRALKEFELYTIDVDLAKFRKYSDTKTSLNELGFVKDIFRLKKQHNGKIIAYDNLRLLFMYIKEPFKKISWFRKYIRRIKGLNPDFTHYR